MNLFDTFSFDNNGVLYSVIIIVILIAAYFLSFRYKPSFVIPFGKISKIKYIFQKIILFSILFFMILIPLNISFLVGKNVETKKNLNIQILFDVSLSMTADDIKPSRFASAKSSVIQLVNNLSGYNISLVTFSGIPFMWSPFTTDSPALVSKLTDMTLGDFPPTLNFVGTAIGDAIILGNSNLMSFTQNDENKSNPGAIILITDGDSNKGADPIEASQLSLKSNIPIYTLGIGRNNYVVGYDHFGSPVTTQINIPLLEKISSTSGGKFYRVLSENDFKGIFDEISKIVKSSETQSVKNDYIYINNYLYGIIAILLFIMASIRIYIILGSKQHT